MVWLDVAGDNGNALYFVTDRVERLRGRGAAAFAVSGIVGDGQYEGEVLVEIGAAVEVTYMDAWLAAAEFGEFERRIDLDRVTAALAEMAAGVAEGLEKHGSGRQVRRGGRGDRVAENAPGWLAVA